MENLKNITELLNILDDEDLQLVYSFVKRLSEDYKLSETVEISDNTDYKKDNFKEIKHDINSASNTNDYEKMYENINDEDFLQRLMLWKND